MKIVWLEDLVKEGHVRPEAAEQMYKESSVLLEKIALDLRDAATMLGVGILGGVGTSAISSGITNLKAKNADAKTLAQISIVRPQVLEELAARGDGEFDKQKAEARFNEIARIAPTVATNKALMIKYIAEKLHSGLTARDAQALTEMQLRFTPSMTRVNNMSEFLSKKASEDPQIAALEKCGEELADRCQALIKCAFGFGLPTSVTEHMGKVLQVVAPSLLVAGGIGAADFLKKKYDQRQIQNQVDASWKKIIQSNNNKITENPIKARQAFDALVHFSPQVATEPLAAASFVSKMLNYDEAGVGIEDVKSLTEIRRNLTAPGVPRSLDVLTQALGASGFGQAAARGSADFMTQKSQDAGTVFSKKREEDFKSRVQYQHNPGKV
jgi:hypothetical protein